MVWLSTTIRLVTITTLIVVTNYLFNSVFRPDSLADVFGGGKKPKKKKARDTTETDEDSSEPDKKHKKKKSKKKGEKKKKVAFSILFIPLV